MTETHAILIETGCSLQELNGEEIVRNFPARTYSIATSDPNKVVDLLAHEAHEWAAEINRVRNKHKRKFELLT